MLLNAAVAPRHPRTPTIPTSRSSAPSSTPSPPSPRASIATTPSAPPTVGIVYPTELVEDLSMILLYRRWLEARGCRVVARLAVQPRARAGDGRVALFGVPVRRLRAPLQDRLVGRARAGARRRAAVRRRRAAGRRRSASLVDAELAGRAAVVNPFGAVLLQNKRTMALMWEAIDRFSPAAQAAIRALPAVHGAPRVAAARRAAPARADWVLKSDYGCEGAEVVIGADVDDAAWADALRHARPGRWVAQRYFAARRDGDGRSRQLRRLRRRRRGRRLLQPRASRRHRLSRHDGGDARRTTR